MAKKKKAAKPAKAKKAAKVVKMQPKSKAKATKKPLRQPALPGTEQVRDKVLDRICEGLSDIREQSNRLAGEEQDYKRQAVRRMAEKSGGKAMAYRAAGIELFLMPGDLKLSVRKAKAENTDPIEDASDDDTTPTDKIDDAPLTAGDLTPDDERLGEQDDDLDDLDAVAEG